MIAKVIDKKKCGIYCIQNIQNKKVYIGKSKNIYRRIVQHIYDLDNQRKQNENQHFLNAWNKYGIDNFIYFVLEYLDENDSICKERELYWINNYKSCNREFGYNLRKDSSTNMIVHEETRQKMSNNLKEQWKSGIRNQHSQKLTNSWKDNIYRKEKQSKLLSTIKTKYYYNIFNKDNKLIETCNYERLKILNIHNIQGTFHRKKTNKVVFKNFIIERINIEDIVQSS